MKHIRLITALVSCALLAVCVMAAGCETWRKEKKDDEKKRDEPAGIRPADAQTTGIALLYTTMSNGGSKLIWLDDDLKESGSTDFGFSAAAYDGYRNMCAADGTVYLFPRGDYVKKDATDLVEIDMADGTYESTDVGRTNVTGYSLDGERIGFSSNLGENCYLDVRDLNTGKTESLQISDRIVLDVALAGDILYGTAINKDLSVSLLACDVKKGKSEELVKLPDQDAPGFLQVDGKDLLFISNGELVRYKTETRESVQTKLTRSDGYNLNLDGSRLWIGYTDLFGEESQKSLIEARDLQTGKVVISQEVDGPIVQVEPYKDGLLVLGYDKLTRFSVSSHGLVEEARIETGMEGYDVGGVFCYDREAAQYGGMSEEEAVDLNQKLFDEVDRMEVEDD